MTASMKHALKVVIATIAILLGLLLIWKASDIFLLAFASILLAVLLHAISSPLSRWIHLPYSLTLILVVLFLLLVLPFIFWLSAPVISDQVNHLVETIPQVYNSLKSTLSSFIDLSALTKEKLTTEVLINHEKIINQAAAIFSFTVGTLTSMLVFGLVAIYLAFTPALYVDGFLKLFKGRVKKRVALFLEQAGEVLRWWLVGKFISMAIIGISSLIGLWLLDIPLAFVLALLAGLLTFIPYLGAILSGIPAVLIALSVSPLKALYVLLLYIAIHAVESYLISPFVDQRTVSLPPALTILAQLVLAILVGFIGFALASPLVVVALLFVAHIQDGKKRA